MTDTTFESLEKKLPGGPGAVIDHLAEQLRSDEKYHELFDALLMKARRKLGLPVVMTSSIDELQEPLRTQVEEAYLASCREVGGLLLESGKLREAWMYLRPVGDKQAMAQALKKIEADEDNVQDLIEIGLHEGVAPIYGYQLVLDNYGTCNAITTYESMIAPRPKADQQAAAALLVRRLHEELLGSLRADIERQEGSPPQERTLKELVADRDWLFLENNYHIDTTHLSSIVRFARVVEDPEVLRLALDLTAYGSHLSSQFQFAGEEPFVDAYQAGGLYFSTLLGERVDEGLAYFRDKAVNLDPSEHGSMPAEIYISLLVRLGRYDEAVEAAAELIPHGSRTVGVAPSLLEISRLAGNFQRLKEACKERGDLLGFAAGLIEEQEKKK